MKTFVVRVQAVAVCRVEVQAADEREALEKAKTVAPDRGWDVQEEDLDAEVEAG